ncbi:FAD-binding domain-containing protein [Fistulina hepatica ATCC 64428]|nr:FAD-binding domain-containing protein [Fistulina hepatica ATCC 64428]
MSIVLFLTLALHVVPIVDGSVHYRDADAIPYFSYETIQLTETNIPSTLFQFEDLLLDSCIYSSGQCKVLPVDESWPALDVWHTLNGTLDGALIQAIPPAAPCYSSWPMYNATECLEISAQWNNSYFHAGNPISVMSPFFQGDTCLPTTNKFSSCMLGGYPSYVVNATTVKHIQLSVNFARNTGIRLIIKNTGHDFLGKSVGAGALSVWTHHLKDIQFLPFFKNKYYAGPALKVGAGVQTYEIYAAAHRYEVTVAGGSGYTVGFAGGFVQGGGHGPLGSLHGVASDQLLALEVVTADGHFVSATPDVNPDLYWAMKGGGGGTFGIVTSVVVKVFPPVHVTTATMSFTTTKNLVSNAFWDGVYSVFSRFPDFADAGVYSYVYMNHLSTDSYAFGMQAFAPNTTTIEYQDLIAPTLDSLAAIGIAVSSSFSYYDNFYDAFFPFAGTQAVGSSNTRYGSRLLPRDNWAEPSLLNATFATLRNITNSGYVVGLVNMAAPKEDASPSAVNPAWWNSLAHVLIDVTWDEDASAEKIKAVAKTITYNLVGQLRAVSPGSGAYLAEADPDERDWQQSFYGSNYPGLYAVKQSRDPCGLFYAPTAVGSEDWQVQSFGALSTQDGRLCKV